MIRVLALAAVLTAAAPAVLAQTASAPAAAPAEAPGEAEFEARAEAFGDRMQAMAVEMRDAVSSAAGDAAKQDADLDAIEVRYAPDTEAFASALEVFINQQAAAVPADQRAVMTTEMATALPQIRSYPQQVRAQVEAAAAAPPAAD